MYRKEYGLATKDGVMLRVREWGDPNGPLVISHHGTPSSSAAVPSGWQSAANSPLCIITFDRPGYGGSPRVPGRSLLDAAKWSSAIADHLLRHSFAVVGTSGGGPHAAATAAKLPERVTDLGLIVSLGPHHLLNSEMSDLPSGTASEVAAARTGELALRTFIEGLGSTKESLDGWVKALPPSDREVVSRAEVRDEERQEQAEWTLQGIDGWVDDDLALFSQSWGFDPRTINMPTRILYGKADVLVPETHALQWMSVIPHANATAVAGGGHWMRDYEAEVLDEIFRVNDLDRTTSTTD